MMGVGFREAGVVGGGGGGLFGGQAPSAPRMGRKRRTKQDEQLMSQLFAKMTQVRE